MTGRRSELIAALEATLPQPRTGLPEDVLQLVSRLAPLVNVDLLIQDERRGTLLTWRDDDLFGPGWHVPGGIIRFRERAADGVHACALDELGTDVDSEPQPIFVLESITRAESRAHHVSMLYRCRLAGPLDEARRAGVDPPQAGQWRWHDCCPPNLLPEQAAYARFI